MQSWPVVVVGAGAAGLLAAIFSGRGGAGTLLLDGRRQPGAKIKVSGGGRCNVLPSESAPTDFETRGSAHVVRNVLSAWPREAVQRFFTDDLGLVLCEEPSGKLFPAGNDAKAVVAALLDAVARAGVTTLFGTRVVGVEPACDGGFVVALEDGGRLHAERLVMATGGLSMPRTGSDGTGWKLLERLGHGLVTPVPALVPLHGAALGGAELQGLSVPARLWWGPPAGHRASFVGDFLFTHRGYSGPVVLDASRHFTLAEAARDARTGTPAPALFATFGEAAYAASAEGAWREALLGAGRQSVRQTARKGLPRRLADALVARGGDEADAPVASMSRPSRLRWQQFLSAVPLPVSSSEGYRTAEVTSGGVPLSEVAYQTLESRRQPGLYVCGEALDASGRIGGFNFLWAWVTGRTAGRAAARAAAPVGRAASLAS